MHLITPILWRPENGVLWSDHYVLCKADKSRISFVLCSFLLAAPAMADDSEPVELDPIVVVASKAPRPLSSVAGQVSVIDGQQVERHVLEGLDDLFRYEPGLNTETSGTRFGVSGVNIRGIGGNRVAIEVDGVPVRDRFATGSYSNGGQALIETGLVKRLEVLHGPASSLYGSDALGGVMAFTTLDPDDLLARGSGDRYFSLRGGYKGQDQSDILNASAAWSGGAHGLMLFASHRDGQELDNNSPAAIPRDPQDWTSEDLFLRYTYDTAQANRLRVTLEDFRRDTATTVNSLLGYSRFRSTTALAGDDSDGAQRLLIDYEFTAGAWEQGVVRVFRSETETRQLTLEERANARTPARYERLFSYDTRLDGLELNLFRSFAAGQADHRLGIGVELLRTRTQEWRDGFQQSLADGSITRTILGEVMPVRDFPNSLVSEWGIFMQDEISLPGDWELIPALRWDRYSLDPRPDAVYLEDYPDTEIVDVDEERVSPRLGVIKKLDKGWSLYGQYVQGFRAPPHEDANIGLELPVFKFRAIPNPDLRSETSTGFEAGIRRFSGSGRFSLAVFRTGYDDFIESRALIGLDPASGYLIFQSRNIREAMIRGLDIRLDQELSALGERWKGWSLNSALYWSEGENRDNGEPLNSVSPPQAVVGVSWQSSDERWDAHLTGTFTRRQQEVDHSDGPLFETPGYSLFDMALGYRYSDWLELRVGVRNLADRRYWRWSDVSRLAAGDPMIQLLSRPGRSYQFSARFQW
jgi:hemoglobin/transferrin/lactoferrin receptor protein